MINEKETIKCPCGKTDTHLPCKGFLYCPPPQGVKCPHCGGWVFPPKIDYPQPEPYEKQPVPPWKSPYPPYEVKWKPSFCY